LKLFQSKGRNNYSLNPDDLVEEISGEEIIKLEKYSDLLNEFYRIIIQKDIERLGNNIQLILDYYYLRETVINHFISDKYKDDNDKRHDYMRVADGLFRVNFEENESIYD
jgi:hypothetical protein